MKFVNFCKNPLLLLILYNSYVNLAQNSKSIRCPLEWKSLANGDPIPPSSVKADNNLIHIVRYHGNSSFLIGSLDGSISPPEAYFPPPPDDYFNENSTAATKFDILTNPHGCIVEWKPFMDGNRPEKFTTQSGQTSQGVVVGRGISTDYDDRFFAGGVNQELEGIVITFGNDVPIEILNSHDVLISYSNGLTLEMSDFTFDTDPFAGSEDFLGSDVVINESPATIKQILTHKKSITEKHSITTSQTWTSVYTETFKLRLVFVTITKTKVTKYERTKTTTVETTETTEVSVSREITVPPYTSIQACSKVSIKETADVPYTAKVKYSSPGLLPLEIKGILEGEGIENVSIDGDFAIVTASGNFTAKLAMNTEFFVKENNDADGCDAMKRGIELKNRTKK